MYLFVQKNRFKIYSIIIFFLALGFSPLYASAATLSISPNTGNFETGERVAVKIMATSNNVPFNAVSGLLEFPASIFSVESVSKTNSVLNFWVTEPKISANTVKFEGIALGGFTGSTGTILTVNLRAVKSGSGQISFKSGQILANDGEGTDITGNLIGGLFSVNDALNKIIKPTPKKEIAPKVIEEVPEIIETPEVVQPEPSLNAPEIVLGSKYGAQAILGSSDYPKAQALITFVSEDGSKVFILGDADADGSFNILIPNSLKHGSYSISSVMIKEDKTNSNVSNTINIRVGNILSDIGYEIYITFALLLILIIYLIVRVTFHFKKGGNTNKNLKREIEKAEDIVHKSFDLIREDVSEYNNTKGENTERKRMSEIKKDINDAEKIIDKEIKNIE